MKKSAICGTDVHIWNWEVVIDSRSTPIRDGSAIIVPAGARHNVRNTGGEPLRIYTLYSPPHHEDGIVRHTKADTEGDDEHFTGRTTE